MKHEASISCYRIPKGNSLITKIFLSAFQEVNHETEIRRASNTGSYKNCIYQFLCHVWSLRSLLKAQSFPPCLQYSMYLLSEEKPDQRQKSVLLSFSFLQGSRFSASSH